MSKLGNVSKPAKAKPVLAIRETKNLIQEGALNKKPKGPHKTYDQGIPHSVRSAQESKKYHAKLLTGRQSAAQVTDQLNPDKTLPARRSFPGLAN